MNQPRKSEPDTLMKNVPHGKAAPSNLPNETPTPQRKRPPAAEPIETSRICMSNRGMSPPPKESSASFGMMIRRRLRDWVSRSVDSRDRRPQESSASSPARE